MKSIEHVFDASRRSLKASRGESVVNSDQIRDYVKANSNRFQDLLKEACAIPSVSAQGQALEEMAAWLQSKLEALGARVSRLDVPNSPSALLGEIAGSGEATLMIYDHYDVQPIDPIGLWETPPFEPSLRDGRIFARGASDNKGDLVARLCALEVYREVIGDLPFTVKFFVEGEEETGSVHFEDICRKYADLLEADDCVWEGGWFDYEGRPVAYYGCKGLLYVELVCRLLTGDQHSSIAVRVPSAVWELLRAIASIKDEKGRIAIDGFHDDIVGLDERERELIEKIPLNEAAELERLGIDSFMNGLKGADLVYESLSAPTANIAGFIAGYTVPGSAKTVLPAEALAKMDFRLVPDQRAEDIAEKLRLHLSRNGFNQVEVEVLTAENPSRSPMDTRLARAVEGTAAEWFPQPLTTYPWMMATGPMFPIAQGLRIPICSPPGVGRPDSRVHAPNENARIDDFLDVIGFTVRYLESYAQK